MMVTEELAQKEVDVDVVAVGNSSINAKSDENKLEILR